MKKQEVKKQLVSTKKTALKPQQTATKTSAKTAPKNAPKAQQTVTKTAPQSVAARSKKTTAQNTFWVPKKVESLLKWYEKYKGTEDAYVKIAMKINCDSKHAVYSKLRRLGVINSSK